MWGDKKVFKGDSEYWISATGDAVVGDEVKFSRAVFEGSYTNPRFAGYEVIEGKIIKDSYGADKQQHTFTLQLKDGSKMRIKGRNLYREGLYRKEWDNGVKRKEALEEKHNRGDAAREKRRKRIEEGIW